MKIKTKQLPYEQVMALPRYRHKKPCKPSRLLWSLVRLLSAGDLKKADFTLQTVGMEKLSPQEPALFLMNHSCFLDLEIAASVLYPRSFHIVCTSDGFVGKERLMRKLGCIPTKKFLTDVTLVRDLKYTVETVRSSVLMYPEASYSFDGTTTPLPRALGSCIKLLKVPVVMITTRGAYQHDPLYNMLKTRQVPVSAEVKYLLSPEEIAAKTPEEINGIVGQCFDLDYYRWQQENHVAVSEPFRADGLERVLYKCPACGEEGKTAGEGTRLTCTRCGKQWELTEYGFLRAAEGEPCFTHIPDWYRWERECVRRELEEDRYHLDIPVTVRMMVDMKCLYEIGEGRLVHTREGFQLTAAGGRLSYRHRPLSSYSLYADYYWYELGDTVCIGDNDALYYCFPKERGVPVAKMRLAAEELYKMTWARERK